MLDMTTKVAVFEINFGSDLEFDIPWPDGADGVLDLTGWTVTLMDVTEAIADLITATQTGNPVDGVITVRLEWSDTLFKNTAYNFRVHITKDGDDNSTNLMRVIYR
jgi:hypothetical protein